MSLHSSRVRLLALAAVLTMLVAAAYGQQGIAPGKDKKAAAPPKGQGTSRSGLAVIQIEHLPASEVQQQLNVLLGDETLRTVPLGNNALAVSAPPETIQEIRDYIASIDVKVAEGPAFGVAQRLQVVTLENPENDEDLPRVLGLFGNIQHALDRQRHAVVLTGPEKDVQEAVKVLRQLEEQRAARPAERPRARNYRVRVVWLANYPGVKELPKGRNLPVPPDLKEVQSELAKMGIDDLRLVSQSLASTNSGEFQVEGVLPGMPGGPPNPRILVKGTILQPGDDRLGLALSLDVGEPGEPQNKLCRLSTRITTTSGHLVVLGVTPADESTSVFVVQVVAQ
jgi:hypothetical protein